MKLTKDDKSYIKERLIDGATLGMDTSLGYLLDEYNEKLGDEIINLSCKLEYKKISSELSNLYELYIRVIENKSGYKMNKKEVKELIDKHVKGTLVLSND